MAEYTHIVQPFEPVYDENSEILILGSLPSVKSRENGFYYGHPQNRFWKVLSAVTKSAEPQDTASKKQMLLIHHIALWDVIKECDIVGSSDSSIKNVVAADLTEIIRKTQIRRIYVNGRAAEKYYKKYIESEIHMKAVVLPSTSPANAAFSLDRLIRVWKDLLRPSEGSYEYFMPMIYDDYTDILQESHMQGIEEDLLVRVWKDLYDDRDCAGPKSAGQFINHKITVWFQAMEDNRILILMSAGSYFDDRIERYEQKEELLKAYIVECYAMGVLRRAYRAFYDEHASHTGTYVAGMRFLDVDDIAQAGKLIEKQGIQDVKINEAMVFVPQKTVAFFTWSQDEKKECTDFNICKQCGNISCINRKGNVRSEPETEAKAENVFAKIKENLENNKDNIDVRTEAIKNNYGYRMIFGNKTDACDK